MVSALLSTLVFLGLCGAIFYVSRRPTAMTIGRVRTGRPTMDLRPESPAVASALVNIGITANGSIPATFLDLAARGHLRLFQAGPEQTIVYLHSAGDALRSYEELFLAPVRAVGTTGEGLPLDDYVTALGFGVAASMQFHRSVHGEVLEAGFLRRVGGFISHESLTPEGRAAASHWLGVREYLRMDDSFARLPPAAVAIWDRYLAYAAGFGIAYAATAPIVAAFARHLPTDADMAAAAQEATTVMVADAPFDPAEFGIADAAPFGPDGVYPLALRGLLAGWRCATGRSRPLSWSVACADRIGVIRRGVPAAAAEDVGVLTATLEHALSQLSAGEPLVTLSVALASVHPVAHRVFSDCAERAAAAGPGEVRRWNILRHAAFHG